MTQYHSGGCPPGVTEPPRPLQREPVFLEDDHVLVGKALVLTQTEWDVLDSYHTEHITPEQLAERMIRTGMRTFAIHPDGDPPNGYWGRNWEPVDPHAVQEPRPAPTLTLSVDEWKVVDGLRRAWPRAGRDALGPAPSGHQ